MIHNVLRQNRPQPTHITQQMLARRIQIHPHTVHRRLHHRIQTLLQQGLIHIVLILPNTNAFRVDFHQLSQRILQSPSDTHRTPHRHILLRKLLPGYGRCAVNTRSRLVHHIHLQPLRYLFRQCLANKCIRFPARRTISDGDGFYAMFFDPFLEQIRGFLRLELWFMRKNGLVQQQIAILAQHHRLTTRSKARIQRQNPLLAQWRRQQQLLRIHRKHPNRFLVGLFLHG